jgi:hypothetical protein
MKKKLHKSIHDGTALATPVVFKTPGIDVQCFNYRLCSAPSASTDPYNVVDTLNSFNQMPANAEYGGTGGCGVMAKKLPIAISPLPIESSVCNKDMIYTASAHLRKPCYMLTRTGTRL